MSNVDKRLLPRLRKPKVVVDAPHAVQGVVRMGTPGVGIYHHGKMTAWGGNETAAWENHKMAQSVRSGLGKNDAWEVPGDHFSPALPNKRPNYGTGNTVGKRMTGVSTGVAKPKKLQPTRTAPRRAAGMLPIGQPPIPPNQVGKREKKYRDRKEARRVMLYDERLPKVNLFDDRAKAYRRAKPMRQSAKEGLKAEGRGALEGSVPGAAIGALVGHRHGRTRAGALIGSAVGAYGGALVRGQKHANKDRRDRLRILEQQGVLQKRDRSYNPEHNRQRRLGLATAATAAGGVALAGHGGRSMISSTRKLRMLADREGHRISTLTQPGSKVSVPIKYEHGNVRHRSHAVTADERAAVRNLAKVPKKMVAQPTRRQLREVGSGAALLGASGGMARYAHSRANREYR